MIAVWSPKGGSGTSVVAAALSLSLARGGGSRLIDLGGDQPAMLGLATNPDAGLAEWLAAPDAPREALDHLTVEAAPGLALLPRGGPLPPIDEADAQRLRDPQAGPHVVVDLGSPAEPVASVFVAEAACVVAVVRPCYLALRRAVGHPFLDLTTGAVIIDEPGRALRPHDVERVLDRPVLAVLRAEARIARAVDAGVLPARLPDPLVRMARRVLAAAGMSIEGEAA